MGAWARSLNLRFPETSRASPSGDTQLPSRWQVTTSSQHFHHGAARNVAPVFASKTATPTDEVSISASRSARSSRRVRVRRRLRGEQHQASSSSR